MYTQCPDCSTAFRVTADVLKQAAGKVRCGGCGNAFNALLYLSETMPEQAPATEAEEALPELKPEPLDNDELPASISAEQSAALLKTLDQLAGSDIRIEDTGVEWRVLDDDEVGDAAGDDVVEELVVEDQPEIDEILEDSPTPVDQFLTETPPEVDSPEIFEAEANEPEKTPVEELRFDDNTPLPEDFGLDEEPSWEPPPVEEPEPEPEAPADEPEEDLQQDLDLSDPEEWTDILDEFEDLGEEYAHAEPEPEEEEEAVATIEDSGSEPLDMDTQFALQAEAMGIDLSGVNEAPDFEEETIAEQEDDLDALLDETQHGDRDLDELLEEELVDDATVGDLDFDEFSADEEAADEEPEDDPDTETEIEFELDEFEEDEPEDDEPEDDEPEDEPEDEHYIPPMTEEEQTINMQIDQDLLAIAVEDDDGFASTMVLPEDAAEDKAAEEKDEDTAEDEEADDEIERALKDTSAGFETIIMEGEHIRTAMEEDRRAADKEAAVASLAGAAAAREAEKSARTGKPSIGMVAGVAALVLLFGIQVLHQSRDALATIPAFNNVVGPMYRAIGKPLSPEWDITGWRFEVTRGNTDENDENLTIYSRIGNNSDKPLPYPLIGISLTDRFEETIGSRVLDPADYLSSDLDPRKLVQPGNTFNAVIAIPSPAEDATGFKLNVCYRESGGNLRCAIDDFK